MLLPHALRDSLPEWHLAYYINDTVDALDLGAFHARYAGGGPHNQPFHPAMMVKVLVLHMVQLDRPYRQRQKEIFVVHFCDVLEKKLSSA